MKSIFIVLFSWPLLCAAADYENYKIQIDWDNPRTLSDSVVQQCDDSYYPAVEIVVPGRPGKDFAVEMGVDITSGRLSPGCTVKKKEGGNSVTYILDAESSCTVNVYQLKPRPGRKAKTATYELHDAC